jgi:hypothetical protein
MNQDQKRSLIYRIQSHLMGDSIKPMNQDQKRLTEDSSSSVGQTIICALLITMTLLISAFLSIGSLAYYLICGGIGIYVTLTTVLFNKKVHQ